MTRNPIVEESLMVYLRTRPYVVIHALYAGFLALATLIVWPGRGYMEFFSSGTVPAAFQAIAILELLISSAINLYAGMDRISSSEIIRYSEWIEHTRLPVWTLVRGKLTTLAGHSLLLVALGAPYLFVAAGPAGIPPRAVFATGLVILLVGIFCRSVGMLISVGGERRDVFRIVSSWLFLAIYYLATIQLVPVLNPIIALVRQQNEESALVSTLDPVRFANHPTVAPAGALIAAIAIVLVIYGYTLHRLRRQAETHHA